MAEIGEVDSEHAQRPELGRAWADRAGERERLLADRPRLVVAPGQHQRMPERRQHLRALRRRWLRRHELDARARTRRRPRRGDRRTAGSGRARVQEPGAHRIAVADERDGLPAELDGARRRARQDGLLGGPGRELGEVEPGELRGVRHVGPQRERALEVRQRLGQAEDRLRLARRLDRRDERLLGAGPPPPSAARARPRPPADRRAPAPRRAARAAPRARPAAAWRRSPRRAARGGSGSRPVRRRARRARRRVAAIRARRAPAAPPPRAAAGSRRRARRRPPAAARPSSGGRGAPPVAAADRAGRAGARRSRRPRRPGAPRRRTGCPPSGRRSRRPAPVPWCRPEPRSAPPARPARADRARAPAPRPSAPRCRRAGAARSADAGSSAR